ncbi:uncharacterized protein SJCHGC06711-like [Chenopodium quinoa]|uniref:uncharacterized protein SJCHGC06711-like n=1 Tax=Chenopodium quinoa TaxID=63459 RepID=UPI000B7892EF|nr:uncharacterized protein SJCHGC06711-like [Chenopodium quinoa]
MASIRINYTVMSMMFLAILLLSVSVPAFIDAIETSEEEKCQGEGNICVSKGVYACCEGLVCSASNIVIGVCKKPLPDLLIDYAN